MKKRMSVEEVQAKVKDFLNKPEVRAETFHNHLDKCKTCRENPFALCSTGQWLLTSFGQSVEKGKN